jgi:hypothetical protein
MLDTPVLVNTPTGMFWLDMMVSTDQKMKLFHDYGVTDAEGRIISTS